MCPLGRLAILNGTDKWLATPALWLHAWICQSYLKHKKANLRDLIAGTGLVIAYKLYSNTWFLSLYVLEIGWMPSKNNRAHLLGYIMFCALFQSHQLIQTGVTIRKSSIPVKIGDFLLSHRSIQTGVTVRKRQIRVKREFFCPVLSGDLTDDLEKW